MQESDQLDFTDPQNPNIQTRTIELDCRKGLEYCFITDCGNFIYIFLAVNGNRIYQRTDLL